MIRVALLALAAAVTCGRASAQTIDVPQVRIEVGNWDLRRHVDLVAAGADVVHAATEAALGRISERTSRSSDVNGRLFRIAKLYLVDLPTVAVAHTLGHEFGHASRQREYEIFSRGFRLENLPWPVPFVNGLPNPGGSSEGRFDSRGLGLESGGYEAGRVRDERFADVFSAPGGVDHFSAARLIYSRLEEPLAAMVYLRESKIRDQNFFLGAEQAGPGIDDMIGYAGALTAIRFNGRIVTPDAQSAARQIRASARWALLDSELWGSFYRVANYLWTGNSVGEVPAIRIGESRFWPRATFALTPVGIARGGELLSVRRNVSVTLRAEKTEQAVALDVTVRDSRGRALEFASPHASWSGSVAASIRQRAANIRVRASVWNQDATGRGGAGEVRIERPIRSVAPRANVSLSLGYKTSGFLAGAPDGSRWYGAVGLTLWPR